MKMSNPRPAYFILVAVFAHLLSFGVGSEARPDVAKVVVVEENWGYPFWLSNTQVLFMKGEYATGAHEVIYTPIVFNLKDHSKTTLPSFRLPSTSMMGSFSPDGKRMLIANRPNDNDLYNGFWSTVELDGIRQVQGPNWNLQTDRGSAWMPDSHQWVRLLYSKHLRNSKNPPPPHPVQLDIFSISPGDVSNSIPLNNLEGDFGLSITSNSHAILQQFITEQELVKFVDIDLKHPKAPARIHTIPSLDFFFSKVPERDRPPEYHVSSHIEYALSPSGKRIAWGILLREQIPGRLLLSPTADTRTDEYYRWVYLCTTDIRGHDLHQIGIVPWAPTQVEGPTISLHWVPGEKSIGFVFRNVLYTMSVR